MLTKNPQNVHRKYFWAILITFICDVKIDINMCEPHYVYLFFLWTSSIVQVFDYLAIDIFLTINLFEDQHTLPKWNILSQSCYCCLFYVLAFQDQHTLPKWNILSQSCYCCLFYVLAFQDQHTLPKWNILSQSCYCCYWPFRTSTPSQSEIFSQIYNKSFQDQTEYFTLGGCAGPERPIATITALRQNISLWEGVLVLKGQYIEQATITALRQNISLWEGVLVLKGQYIEQATITAFHRIFHFGRVCWSWKANT